MSCGALHKRPLMSKWTQEWQCPNDGVFLFLYRDDKLIGLHTDSLRRGFLLHGRAWCPCTGDREGGMRSPVRRWGLSLGLLGRGKTRTRPKKNRYSCVLQGREQLHQPWLQERGGGFWPVILSSPFCLCKDIHTIRWFHKPGCIFLPSCKVQLQS